MILYVISSGGILYEHGAHIVVLFYTQYLSLLFHNAEPFILTFLLNTVIVVNREEEGGAAGTHGMHVVGGVAMGCEAMHAELYR